MQNKIAENFKKKEKRVHVLLKKLGRDEDPLQEKCYKSCSMSQQKGCRQNAFMYRFFPTFLAGLLKNT